MGFYFVVDVVELLLSVGPGRGSIYVLVFPRIEKLIVNIPDRAAKRT